MNVVFRVDASTNMGIGHVTRCLTLANALRNRGIECSFICREHNGHLLSLLKDVRMPVAALPAPAVDSATGHEDYASWLGVTQREDANQSVRALDGEIPDWIVVDHYALDVDWERQVRPHAKHLMVIDDLANRAHDCDLLVDQNVFPCGESRYSDLVPAHCNVLLRPQFALLRPEYAAYRRTSREDRGEVQRIFVFFGGSDPGNLTRLALEALSHDRLRNIEVDIVIGANYVGREELQQQAANRPGTFIHGPRPHLAELMAQADLAIGAGGVTTWERMCIGLPSIVISIAENQRPACEVLAERGLIRYLGNARNISATALSVAIDDAVASVSALLDQSSRCQLMVDGLGTIRVAEFIDPTEVQELTLRRACDDDVGLYFKWVNDLQVRRHAMNTGLISWPQHQTWFRARLADRMSQLFVMEAKGLPVGQIRFDLYKGEARIDYSLDSTYRGRGWGKSLVTLGMHRMCARSSVVFRAEVKTTNIPSSKIFRNLGFSDLELGGQTDLRVFRFDSATQTLCGLQ